MDREATFRRFMELAPELRLCVYEALLIAPQGKHRRNAIPEIHPAILRTSKQVCSEAMPVLYKENKFRADIRYSEASSRSRHAGVVPVCTFAINGPGGEFSFYHRTCASIVTILRSLFEHSSAMHMLRILTYLTIDIDLVTPRGKQGSGEYSMKAYDAMKSLCLSTSGSSNAKGLTVRVKPGDQDSSDVDPADILWPLLFLREDVIVKFEDITSGLEKTLTEYGKSPEVPVGKGAAGNFNGSREAEKALVDLKPPEKQLLNLNDIVNMSPVWKGLRCEIASEEASASEQ